MALRQYMLVFAVHNSSFLSFLSSFHTDYVDSSGLRITYTPTLRKHDSGTLEIGAASTNYLIIPPHIKDFRSTGFCSAACMNKGLANHPSGVQVFAVLQHAHLLGRGIRTRVFRRGVEIEPLAYDENYDFDYQDYRHIRKYRTLLPGDELIVECKYDSTGRNKVTVVRQFLVQLKYRCSCTGN